MSEYRRLLCWAGIAATLCLSLWLFRSSLSPFLFGAAVAYFLDPVVDRLEAWRCPRAIGAAAAMLLAALAALLVLLLVLPLLAAQAIGLLAQVPDMAAWLRDAFARLLGSPALAFLGGASPGSALEPLWAQGAGTVAATLRNLLQGGNALLEAAAFLAIAPVAAYYLLVDWDRVIGHFDRLIPLDQRAVVRGLAREVDAVLAAFLRGQVTVCLVLAALYSTALFAIGLEHALAVGVAAGLVAFIPYAGTALGLALSTGLAVLQFWPDYVFVALVAFVFVAGQILESYVLTPKLVGRRVGLHPVWLLFALLAGGNLLGFAGLLAAVPIAAVVGVVVRFGEKRYRRSRLYRGDGESAAEAPVEDVGGKRQLAAEPVAGTE